MCWRQRAPAASDVLICHPRKAAVSGSWRTWEVTTGPGPVMSLSLPAERAAGRGGGGGRGGVQRGDSRRTPPTAVTAGSVTGCLRCPPRQHPARALCATICISKALYTHYLINPPTAHNSSLSYTTISCRFPYIGVRIFLMYFNCYFAVT